MSSARAGRRRAGGRGGFTLVEATVSTLIVAGLLAAALTAVTQTARSREILGERARGYLLAQEMMEEIFDKAYADPDGGTGLGPDSGETGTDRGRYDDIDDYHNLSNQPPRRLDGTAYEDLPSWRRTVRVEYVLATDMNYVRTVDGGYKRITVEVYRGDVLMASLVAVRCREH